jgi:thiol-disulfide isomerase/thioredoxin
MTILFKQITLAITGMCLATALLLSCRNNTAKEAETAGSELTELPVEVNSHWPKPNSYTGDIPVYNTFEALEPIFRFENDTTYVINFWATWCAPCIKELPYLEAYSQEMQAEKVRVILVSLDFPGQLESKLRPFVQKQQLKSEVMVLLDGKYNNWIDKVSPDWSGAIPATLIYKGGRNYLEADPFENIDELREVVEPFL